MSEVPEGDGWWQASDGRWYPPETAPGFVPPGSTGATPGDPSRAPGGGDPVAGGGGSIGGFPSSGGFPASDPYLPPGGFPPYVPPGQGTPPPGWQPPPGTTVYGGYGSTTPKTSSFAIAALICGIASIPLTVCCLGLVLGPVAIYLGVRAKEEIRASSGAETGEGMATAGVVTGIIGGIMSVIWLFLAFAGG